MKQTVTATVSLQEIEWNHAVGTSNGQNSPHIQTCSFSCSCRFPSLLFYAYLYFTNRSERQTAFDYWFVRMLLFFAFWFSVRLSLRRWRFLFRGWHLSVFCYVWVACIVCIDCFSSARFLMLPFTADHFLLVIFFMSTGSFLIIFFFCTFSVFILHKVAVFCYPLNLRCLFTDFVSLIDFLFGPVSTLWQMYFGEVTYHWQFFILWRCCGPTSLQSIVKW